MAGLFSSVVGKPVEKRQVQPAANGSSPPDGPDRKLDGAQPEQEGY